ncbi:predicted protein [Arabidopsis lyrata subsp. lyrata]|uniref:Predicted protein n=1 Tax=Arabidopsis lyrata subsp. lyrata TaxID=81972 RepID=D7KG82_ARALL|nr:predicted protein [Arabidopsis lyrata subsp. lyrata]
MAHSAPSLEEEANKTWRQGEIYDARAIHEPWPMHEAVNARASCSGENSTKPAGFHEEDPRRNRINHFTNLSG